MNKRDSTLKTARITGILKPYRVMLLCLAVITILGNGLGLIIPKLISRGIDSFAGGYIDMNLLALQFSGVALAILALTYTQGLLQTYVAERAGRDIRTQLADKISRMSYSTLEKETPSKLLTNLTSDIEAVKLFISMAVITLISSIILIIGSASLLISINVKLALSVLALLPLIGILFAVVFTYLGPLFKKGQEIIDHLNRVISESIVGAALIRVCNSQETEIKLFTAENTAARTNGMGILKLFSIMIPSIGLVTNMATLIIVLWGGKFVIDGTLSLGDFTAFNAYVFILVFPIIMIGFVSNIISRAQSSYARISEVLALKDAEDTGTLVKELSGALEVRNLTVAYGEKKVLSNVSFTVKPGTKTAIIGPTAAGKTQLVSALIGLITPSSGEIRYDDKPLESYTRDTLHRQVAIVFQDSVMFNMSIKENIAFGATAQSSDLDKALRTAELGDFIKTLPHGLDTVVSERGTSLSGGQKQRIMLARALALNPRILLLDDFTARVDAQTEKKILANLHTYYPDITLISVTQKIRSIEHFDKVVLLMEGELLAEGTHDQLSQSSPEYMQIMESQRSTESYE